MPLEPEPQSRQPASLRYLAAGALGASAMAIVASLFMAKPAPLSNTAVAAVPVQAATPQVGQPAPDFDLPEADGGRVRLAALRGHEVLLVFYRTHT